MSFWRCIVASVLVCFAAVGSSRAAVSPDELIRQSGIRGGIVVHVGCDDGRFTAGLLLDDRFLVHGLDTDRAHVMKARRYMDSTGQYGQIWAEVFDGKNLPHGDNVANLMVLEDAFDLTAEEISRVLVPEGAVLMRTGDAPSQLPGLKKTRQIDGWVQFSKTRPEMIDEWTHFLHGPSGNAVSRDKKVGHPRHLQWYAPPKHTRHHDALASMSAMTSSDGRLFYILDEGLTSVVHSPPDWKLIARDAFNGKLLWKRNMPDWMTHLYNFRAGPKQLPRRLVSVGDGVYATLGLTAPVVKLDAATGKTLLTCDDSEMTEEIICHDGRLLIVRGDPEILIDKADQCHGYWELAEHEEPTVDKSIVAYDTATGRRLWSVQGDNLKHLTPLSLCARENKVFYLDNKQLHCLDLETGNSLWAAPFETEGLFIRSYAPTVVVHDDVIMCLKWNRLCAYSVSDGRMLWENKGSIGFGSPGDLFVIGGKVWTNPMRKSIWRKSRTNKEGIITTGISIPKTDFLNQAETGVGIDIHTGEITDLLPFEHNQHHHRCYRDKATEKYILIGHSGIQLVDPVTKKGAVNQWVRGLCQYGIMPANGYIYVPPDPCRCYGNAKINGFFALAERNSMEDVDPSPILEKGPDYGRAPGEDLPQDHGAWPTFRGNDLRSGSVKTTVDPELVSRWRVDLGPGISQAVIAGGRAFVAQKDAYTVHCLNRNDGTPVWKFLAAGPIDSPPSIYSGLCVFGCGDGSVYCLNAENGRLVWRFKVTGLQRRVGSDDRLESPLAVSGSVLVLDNTVYFAAGRSSYLDGGIRIVGLDVRTGEETCRHIVASGYWESITGEGHSSSGPGGKGKRGIAGALADILISDGNTITMRNICLNMELESAGRSGVISTSTGFLDASWFHRQNWSFQRNSGQLMAYDDSIVCSVINPYTGLKRRRKGQYTKYNQVGHFHQKFATYEPEFFPVGSGISGKALGSKAERAESGYQSWSIEEPLQPRAVVLAGENLCLAGWMDSLAIEPKTGRAASDDPGDKPEAVLRVYSAKDGERLAEYRMNDVPVFDGASAAYGNLFLSLKDGSLVCMGPKIGRN